MRKYSINLGYFDDRYYLMIRTFKLTTMWMYISYRLFRYPNGALFCKWELVWPIKGVTDPSEKIETGFVMNSDDHSNDNERIRLT
jgi:hypothetical protein